MNGLRLAAIYGFPPSHLGFCGPATLHSLQILSRYISGENHLESQVRTILSQFAAAFGYYQLIASENNISDPFDKKVVEAYWAGNELLDNVSVAALKRMILSDFIKPGLMSTKDAQNRIKSLPGGVKAHHSFHVLVLGAISGRVELDDRLRDLCRVGWGKVEQLIKDKQLIVKSRPLTRENDRFVLGQPVEREIERDKSFVPDVEVGQTVTFHWNKVCQVISREQEANLEKYTQTNLDALNEHRKVI